jgi:uncharacterized protein YbjT (DUF2867 family)
MILVTGGPNFIGRSVIRQLTAYGYTVRSLLRPSQKSPSLPPGVSVDVTLAALTDRRGVRAAMVDIDTVIHLSDHVGPTHTSRHLDTEVEGTRNLAEACADAGVERMIYLSYLGADRSAAYPAMRAKAIAEEHLRASGVPYTILRTAILFGRDDFFTVPMAEMLSVAPLFFPMPGDGSVLLQPLWIEDLATCSTWILDERETIGATFEIGGPEFLSFRQILELIMRAASSPRIVFSTRPPYLRIAARFFEWLLPKSPVTPLWVDYLAVNRTADLNTLPSVFGLQPSRMEGNLDYLHERNWGWELLAQQFSRGRGQ